MPRQARLDVLGVVHHVMARGIDGTELFRDTWDRERFIERLGEVVTAGGGRLYAWCLLPNHFHLLLRPEQQPLSWLMRRLMTAHAVRYNLRHGRKGHLFQNRYKSVVVEEEPYFLEVVRYIHLNPMRARMIQSLDELERFPYSGHAALMGTREAAWQAVDEVLLRFGDQRDEAIRRYRKFLAGGVHQGQRKDLSGGGLVRSAGGWEQLALQRPEEREAGDERILGSGAFVEELWRAEEEADPVRPPRPWREILEETAQTWDLEPERILGSSRERYVAKVRREFLLRAVDEAGMSIAALGRLCGRNHASVSRAVAKAREEASQTR